MEAPVARVAPTIEESSRAPSRRRVQFAEAAERGAHTHRRHDHPQDDSLGALPVWHTRHICGERASGRCRRRARREPQIQYMPGSGSSTWHAGRSGTRKCSGCGRVIGSSMLQDAFRSNMRTCESKGHFYSPGCRGSAPSRSMVAGHSGECSIAQISPLPECASRPWRAGVKRGVSGHERCTIRIQLDVLFKKEYSSIHIAGVQSTPDRSGGCEQPAHVPVSVNRECGHEIHI